MYQVFLKNKHGEAIYITIFHVVLLYYACSCLYLTNFSSCWQYSYFVIHKRILGAFAYSIGYWDKCWWHWRCTSSKNTFNLKLTFSQAWRLCTYNIPDIMYCLLLFKNRQRLVLFWWTDWLWINDSWSNPKQFLKLALHSISIENCCSTYTTSHSGGARRTAFPTTCRWRCGDHMNAKSMKMSQERRKLMYVTLHVILYPGVSSLWLVA